MFGRAILVTLTSMAALALARLAVPAHPETALPYYDTRDFTPRWAPVEHRVTAFHLVDQRGDVFTESDLHGRIHVASFLFTSCPSVCPVLVQRLKPVQETLRGRDDALMVSYSVTPLTDTPKVLSEFGALRGIDPKIWRLATGDLSEVKRVLHDSYFADDIRSPDGDAGRLLHTEKVLLVDVEGRLRGIYNGTIAFEVERLIEDIETLRREKGRH